MKDKVTKTKDKLQRTNVSKSIHHKNCPSNFQPGYEKSIIKNIFISIKSNAKNSGDVGQVTGYTILQ